MKILMALQYIDHVIKRQLECLLVRSSILFAGKIAQNVIKSLGKQKTEDMIAVMFLCCYSHDNSERRKVKFLSRSVTQK